MNRVDSKIILLTVIGIFLIVHCKICQSESMKQGHTVLIASGHVKEPASDIDNRGATSYSGIFEYEFNDAVVGYFGDKRYHVSGLQYNVIPASRNLGLRERVEYANIIMPELYLEIHHDAAQAADIEKARKAGEDSPLWKDISGFSVHYSENNPFPERSKAFAQLFADEMLMDGFKPNLYHANAEEMPCIDRDRGVYNRISPWGLYVLNTIKSPSVIIECGTIINPHEEKYLVREETRLKIVDAINHALVKYFGIE